MTNCFDGSSEVACAPRNGVQHVILQATSSVVSPTVILARQPYVTSTGATFDPATIERGRRVSGARHRSVAKLKRCACEARAKNCRAPDMHRRCSRDESIRTERVDVWSWRGVIVEVSGMDGGEVLLVDDDDAWLRACERGFQDLGATVYAATCVADSLAIAREHPLELVVADVRLRGESGIDVVEAMRAAHPQCTIVVVSAYLSVALTAAVMRKGADQVLFKPVHPAEILQRARALDAADTDHAWTTPTLARAEWEHISRVLLDCNGNVSEAARRLGILRQSLQRRLRKHPPSQ